MRFEIFLPEDAKTLFVGYKERLSLSMMMVNGIAYPVDTSHANLDPGSVGPTRHLLIFFPLVRVSSILNPAEFHSKEDRLKVGSFLQNRMHSCV